MRDQFDEHTAFTRLHKLDLTHCDSEGWLLLSPLGVSTEREIHAVANGGRIYRSLFERIQIQGTIVAEFFRDVKIFIANGNSAACRCLEI